MTSGPLKTAAVLLAGILIAAILFMVSLLPRRASLSPLENIHGITFPAADGAVHVYEPLAHADVYLDQPTLFKQLDFSITFIPGDITHLSVGVRENPFWLSYTRFPLYESTRSSSQPVTASVSIPLSDKLQESDRSVDLMFFAAKGKEAALEDAVNSTLAWQLQNISASVSFTKPAYPEIKDWIKSIFYRERAL